MRLRAPIVALALIALLGAMWGGLLRIGWNWPLLSPPLLLAHGPLMVSGFIGTLIGLERAVALGQRWAYAGPALNGTGALLLMVGVPGWIGPLLMTLGSAIVFVVLVLVVWHQPALFTAMLGLGALAWLLGNVLWLGGWTIPTIVSWWLAFLVVTVAGERLELSRLLRLTPWRIAAFLSAIGLLVGGLLLSLFALNVGVRCSGAGMLALALWLARYDLARRTVHRTGLTRFIAISLLAGYGWLAVGGVLALWYGGVMVGPAYDAQLHAVFLGFAISMVFGHAPIVVPAVLKVPAVYDWTCYVPLALLHASLMLRMTSDLASWFVLLRIGGLLNAVALLMFLANTARLAYRAGRQPPSSASRGATM